MIVFGQPCAEIARHAAVMHRVIRLTNQYVNVLEGFHWPKNHSSKKAGLPSRSL
jgi:hypothetical protein